MLDPIKQNPTVHGGSIKTNKITSIGIRKYCGGRGIKKLGSGGVGDNRMTLYEVDGREVIETNGDPVWDHEEGFDIIREQIMGAITPSKKRKKT
jgi:hypothetical protein